MIVFAWGLAIENCAVFLYAITLYFIKDHVVLFGVRYIVLYTAKFVLICIVEPVLGITILQLLLIIDLHNNIRLNIRVNIRAYGS